MRKKNLIVIGLIITSIAFVQNAYAGNYEDAKALFQRSLDTDSDKIKIEYRKKIVEIVPESDIGYFSKAYLYDNDGKLDKALMYYTKAITLNPKFDFAYANRGSIYLDKNSFDKTIADYSKVLEINPDFKDKGQIYVDRSRAYYGKKMFNEAINDLNTAIKLDKKNEPAFFWRGVVYMEKGLYDKAIDDFTTSTILNPSLFSSYYNRGNAFSLKGMYNVAINDYSTAIGKNGKAAWAYCNRGLAYGRIREYDKAKEDYSAAINMSLSRTDNDYYRVALVNSSVNLGNIYLNTNEFDQAIYCCNKAIKNRPEAVLYLLRGNAYYYKHDNKAAKLNWEKTVELDQKGRVGAKAKENLKGLKLGQPIPEINSFTDQRTLNYYVE